MSHRIYFIISFCVCFLSVPDIFAQDTGYYPGIRSRKMLLEAKQATPENHAMSYYLGWSYFMDGNQEAAIDEWETYLKQYPDNAWARLIRQQLTLIKANQSAAYARITAKQDPGALSNRINKNRVVVLNLKNRSYSLSNSLSKGITDLIITDLSKIPQLKVVSRMRMQALIHEMQLGEPGIVDTHTAHNIGRLLLSGNALWGEFTDISETEVNILLRITETSGASEVAGFRIKGAVASFNTLQKKMVYAILIGLKINKKELDPQTQLDLDKPHFNNFSAFTIYAMGLDYLDKRQFSKAKEAFKKAVNMDPTFDLAQKALTFTPQDTIIPTFIEPVGFNLEAAPNIRIPDKKPTDIGIDDAHERILMDIKKAVSH